MSFCVHRCKECDDPLDDDDRETFDRRYDRIDLCNNCNMDALKWRERV